MAAGDFNITASSLRINGQQFEIDGDAEVDGTLTAFDIFPDKHVLSFDISGEDDAGAVEVHKNEDASGTEDQGSIAMASQTRTVNTYNWTAKFV